MGTNAAEVRLLWSPFSCPSVEDPLKDKQVGETCGRKARSSTGPLMAVLLALGVSSRVAHFLVYFKTLFTYNLIREDFYD